MSGPGVLARLQQAWKDRPRRRRLVVTDITRMDGDRVCVAGFLPDEDNRVVRPVCARGGPREPWLLPASEARVIPFAVLDLNVAKAPRPLVAPHTEDRVVPTTGHRLVGTLSPWEQIAWLESSLSPSLRDVFGATVRADPEGQWGRYVQVGEGERSLGTIKSGEILAVRYAHYPERGRWDYRLRFRDATGEEFQLAVVDLAFRRRLDDMRHSGFLPDRVAAETLAELRRQAVYLRVGLARGWEKHPDRCYLQVTGVYGYPEQAAAPTPP